MSEYMEPSEISPPLATFTCPPAMLDYSEGLFRDGFEQGWLAAATTILENMTLRNDEALEYYRKRLGQMEFVVYPTQTEVDDRGVMPFQIRLRLTGPGNLIMVKP
jgi:hypothetical protein